MDKIKVLLVDDHTILRDGIASILSHVEGIQVVGGLSSGEDAVNSFKLYDPNVILMDILMGGMTGLEATRWIKEQDSGIKVIIISSEIKKEFVSMGIKCGIDGYLPKDVDKETLVTAIRAVSRGEKYFNTAITNLVFEDFYHGEKDGKKRNRKIAEGLTKRENEILELIASGKTNQEVADSLFISTKTVETHKANILEKLGLRNTAELVKYAIKKNIISLE
ncbi:MAG TPA: response regulator transcription factor [Chryseosolibacter sp.]|nr:response regulator transcription factor [Chryseosolibacter sp.]